jgi:hypothetical protein
MTFVLHPTRQCWLRGLVCLALLLVVALQHAALAGPAPVADHAAYAPAEPASHRHDDVAPRGDASDTASACKTIAACCVLGCGVTMPTQSELPAVRLETACAPITPGLSRLLDGRICEPAERPPDGRAI